MCEELKTHTDGKRGLCKTHAHQVKQEGGDIALELEPTGKGKAKTCEWQNSPQPEPEDSEQQTEG